MGTNDRAIVVYYETTLQKHFYLDVTAAVIPYLHSFTSLMSWNEKTKLSILFKTKNILPISNSLEMLGGVKRFGTTMDLKGTEAYAVLGCTFVVG